MAAPDVDITSLQVAKQNDEINRFEKETVYDRKQNHLTGFIQDAKFDVSRFNDERVRFDNTGLSMNPTDGAGVTSSMYVGQMRSQQDGAAASDSMAQMGKKAKRREMKAKR